MSPKLVLPWSRQPSHFPGRVSRFFSMRHLDVTLLGFLIARLVWRSQVSHIMATLPQSAEVFALKLEGYHFCQVKEAAQGQGSGLHKGGRIRK